MTTEPTQASEPKEVQELSRDSWTPVTPELLREIALGCHGSRFWIAGDATPTEPVIGTYEWWQGRSPHGFNVNGERLHRIPASEVTHLMLFRAPNLPWEC